MWSTLGPTCLGLSVLPRLVCLSFTKLGKFSFVISSNKFSISCSSSSPSGTPVIQMLVHLEMAQRLLRLYFFWILVSLFSPGWLFIYSLCSKSLVWILASFPSLWVPCGTLPYPETHFSVSLNVASISSLMLLAFSVSSLSILITSVLNLHLIGWLSLFCLVLFLGFVLFFHLGHISLSPQFGSLPVFVSVY